MYRMATRKVNLLDGIKVDGKAMAAARRAKDLSQRKLAEVIERTENTIVSIEAERRQPSPKTLAAICAALGVEQDAITETVPE